MNRQTQMKNILDNWNWFQGYKADNKKVARFFYYIMIGFSILLFCSIWLEPQRGSIGSLVRLNPAFLFIVSQLLMLGIVIYAINIKQDNKSSNLLWFLSNGGVLFLCFYPLVDNLYQLTTIPGCPLFNSNGSGICGLTAWHSIILLQMLAFYKLFFTTQIDVGNESQVRQTIMLESAAQLALTDNNQTDTPHVVQKEQPDVAA